VNTANVRVLADANTPDSRAFPPRTILVLLAALMFGAFAGAGAGFARDWTDDRVHSRRDLEAACQYPVLAEIPPLAGEFERKGALSHFFARLRARRQGTTMMATLLDAPGSAFAQSIHRLRYVLRAPAAPHLTLFLSAGEAGARAEVALNFALATATNQPRVILVDADLGRRGISRRVVGGAGEGLADVAADRVKLDAALIVEPQTRLRVLQAGGAPAAVVNPDSVLKVLEQARTTDTVIVDGPSSSLDPLSPALAAATDFAVLVVTAGVTRARDIAEFQRSTDHPPGKVRGVVFVSADGPAL
jgi:succinoglycan biosynthesis transport protein ExoP